MSRPSLETLGRARRGARRAARQPVRRIGKPRGGAQHVPKGEGLEVVRRGTKRGHTYHLLRGSRPARAFEPFLVTLNDKSEVFPGFEHPGTEFIYLLEGSLTYRHGDETHLLKAGDALTFAASAARSGETAEDADPNALDHHLRRRPGRPLNHLSSGKCATLHALSITKS